MAFRTGEHPDAWPLTTEAEDEFACNDIRAARVETRKALKAIDATEMPRNRSNARPYLLQAVVLLEDALKAMERER